MSDWNDKIIEEFHANHGKVGGAFEGANLILLHHVGRSSGTEYVAPVVFFTEDEVGSGGAASTMYVVASAAGAPKSPQWYANMISAGHAGVEVGTGTPDVGTPDVGAFGIDTFEVGVVELRADERDRVFGRIKAVAPGFADYERKTQGIRTIPVLALRPLPA